METKKQIKDKTEFDFTIHGCVTNLTDELLYIYHANAYKTGAICIGHNKTAHNEILVKKYEDEIVSRNLPSPRVSEQRGEFNGKGSY